jgi:hypothetical protein
VNDSDSEILRQGHVRHQNMIHRLAVAKTAFVVQGLGARIIGCWASRLRRQVVDGASSTRTVHRGTTVPLLSFLRNTGDLNITICRDWFASGPPGCLDGSIRLEGFVLGRRRALAGGEGCPRSRTSDHCRRRDCDWKGRPLRRMFNCHE